MLNEEIEEITCNCRKKDFNTAYRDPQSNHILCSTCHKPFQALAKFKCIGCGESSVNLEYYHEFNLFEDYYSDGTLKTLLTCKACDDAT